MKKIRVRRSFSVNGLLILVLVGSIASSLLADGGAIGVQLGRVTFGLGGSSNGPIIGIGPSPDNDLPLAIGYVPGDDYGYVADSDYYEYVD